MTQPQSKETKKKNKDKELTLVPVDKNKPDHPCWICGNDNWWQTPYGAWLCNRCHPKPK